MRMCTLISVYQIIIKTEEKLTYLYFLLVKMSHLEILYLALIMVVSNNGQGLFYRALGIPILDDCESGRDCFDQIIGARPNFRLRFVTNQILDRLNGVHYEKNQLKQKKFELEEKMR